MNIHEGCPTAAFVVLSPQAPTDNKIHNGGCEDDKENNGAMLVEWRNIPLWRLFYHLFPPLRDNDGVGSLRLSPFASRL